MPSTLTILHFTEIIQYRQPLISRSSIKYDHKSKYNNNKIAEIKVWHNVIRYRYNVGY